MNVIKFLAKLIEKGREVIDPKNDYNGKMFNRPTRQKKMRTGTTNHGKGESKVRRKMAARSRRINRK